MQVDTNRSALIREALNIYLLKQSTSPGYSYQAALDESREIKRLKAREQELLEKSELYLRDARDTRAALNAALSLIEGAHK